MKQTIKYALEFVAPVKEVEIEIDVPAGIRIRDTLNVVSIYVDGNSSLEVYKEVGKRLGSNETLPAQVNWFSCGAQSAEFTEWFATVLLFASYVANEINKVKRANGEIL